MATRIRNHVNATRRKRGVSASCLAEKVGVSRQTIHAIEAGTYVPNTEVSLKLARELEVKLEELFFLPEEPQSTESLAVEVVSASPITAGQPVRLCHVGDRLISIPVSASPCYLPESDGVTMETGVVAFSDDSDKRRFILAGCDPAISLISQAGFEIIAAPASSQLALTWLEEGKVHVAGSHLLDPETGEFNLPFIRRKFAGQEMAVVTYARWEEGFVVAKGNPKGIRRAGDLASENVKIVNREKGSGSRALLDKLLGAAGIDRKVTKGYNRELRGHLAAAYAVLQGEADCCLATRSAAKTFGLDFVPLQAERYDFVM